jgi:hypothetical protein
METDSPASPQNEPDVPQAVTDEELFEAYLSARLTQALDTLNRARDELAAEPHDFNRALIVMRRVHELRDLQQQLEAQRARVGTTRSAAGLGAAAQDAEPVVLTTPGAAFRAAQSEQAEKIMAALSARPRTCPSCQALLDPHTVTCHCGFRVEADSGLLGFDAEERNSTPYSAP